MKTNEQAVILFQKMYPFSQIPTRGSYYAAGLDLYSTDNIVIEPGARAIIGTGIKAEIPNGNYLRIAPRSGLAAKSGIDVMAGVVDSDYRGEIKVILVNHGQSYFNVGVGDRIAQAILEKYTPADVVEVNEISETERAHGGFGSTGN